jgi:hypothetical protein
LGDSYYNNGKNFGHMGPLHVHGAARFEMSEPLMETIASKLDQARPVGLVWRNTGRTPSMVTKLTAYLRGRGFEVEEVMDFESMTGVHFEKPVSISANGFNFNGIVLAGGMQAIALDASVA